MKKTPKVTKTDIEVTKLLKVLKKLKPFFEDSANYTGIYEKDVFKLCQILTWERK